MKNTLAFSLLAALLLIFTWVSASEDIGRDLSSGIVRLHILANSDTPEDQALKLKVRNRLLSEAKQTPKLLSDKEITEICQDEIKTNGYTYPVAVSRGRFHFPQKTYDNLTLPAGTYNAVRIIIGEGDGQNWWCVMYPPLCFTGSTNGTLDQDALAVLKESLKPESLSMICESDSITIKPSFKLVELWNELKTHLKK
ncbi:MAG: stage II sporulation protein R [Clostridia bacterium]|nr:stage II sporulation protein R [Clostridia bacterium]